MTLQGTDAVDVGGRLRGAREATGLTQSDVAADLRVARTTLVAMEQGRRRVRTDELQRLARLYGTSVNALLRREAVHVDLVPRFRKLWTTNEESMERAARLMTDLVFAVIEGVDCRPAESSGRERGAGRMALRSSMRAMADRSTERAALCRSLPKRTRAS